MAVLRSLFLLCWACPRCASTIYSSVKQFALLITVFLYASLVWFPACLSLNFLAFITLFFCLSFFPTHVFQWSHLQLRSIYHSFLISVFYYLWLCKYLSFCISIFFLYLNLFFALIIYSNLNGQKEENVTKD